jgi:CheY-like chemotaxis protein
MSSADPFPLFVVEDSDDDLFLFKRLLAKAEINHPIDVATNGQSAIEQLGEAAAGSPNRIPRIVFVDLKLPLRSGFEVLEWIRSQPRLRQTAVIVLSSSAELRDVKRAYELGAHGYLVKYPGPAVFRDIVRIAASLGPDSIPDQVTFPGVARPPA